MDDFSSTCDRHHGSRDGGHARLLTLALVDSEMEDLSEALAWYGHDFRWRSFDWKNYMRLKMDMTCGPI
jgi:hypothetical protein